MSIFNRLNIRYSFGNEDPRTELMALKIKPQDKVVCVTASGDRPLHLLLTDCRELVSIDLNQVQNYLLDLKIVAMSHLDYDQYISFIGGAPSSSRKETLRKLASHMKPEAANFWLAHEKAIEKGVLYQGTTERLLKFVGMMFSILRPSKIKRLFQFDNLEEQKTFIQRKWENALLKRIFNIVLSPGVARVLVDDPGLYSSNVDPSITAGTYLYNRMNDTLCRSLAKENPFVSLILRGKVEKEAFPPYLTQEGTEVIKNNLKRLTYKTMNMIDYLDSSPESSIDCYSVSDIASYMGKNDFHRMLRAMVKSAKPGARFSIRQFMSGHQIPPELVHHFHRDQALEKELEEQENCFVYRFIVGTIKK